MKFIVTRKATGGFIFQVYSSNYIGTYDTLEKAQEALKDADEGQYTIFEATEVADVSVEVERKIFSYGKVEL
jgi:hypothetical protein